MDKTFLKALYAFSDTILQINTKTELVHPYKMGDRIIEDPDLLIDRMFLINEYRKTNLLNPKDLWQLDLLADLNLVIYQCQHDISTSLVFRLLDGEPVSWCRVDLFLADNYSDENPYLYLISHRLSQKEAYFFDSYSVFSRRFLKILHVDLKASTYRSIKDYQTDPSSREKPYENSYPPPEEFVKTGTIHPEDIPAFCRHLDADYVKSYFAYGNREMNFYYRRIMGGLFRWVKLGVIPAATYSVDNPVLYYFIEDVHTTMLKVLDMNSASNYAKFYKDLPESGTDTYYENLLSVLHGFTQHYVDFYLIHLDKDLFVRYRASSGILGTSLPVIGNYTQSSKDYIREFCSGEQAEILNNYSSSEKLRELMRNRLVLEYEFISPDGSHLKTICQKIESTHGVPTKLICRTVKLSANRQLRVRTFGNFEVLDENGEPIRFSRKQSKQLLAYLIDKQGFPVTSKDIVMDILEKPVTDMNAIKYVSTMIRRAVSDLEAVGYPDLIIKEQKSVRINPDLIDCDYYHLLQGDFSYLLQYHNEYMKEYSWAESTNAEILSMVEK